MFSKGRLQQLCQVLTGYACKYQFDLATMATIATIDLLLLILQCMEIYSAYLYSPISVELRQLQLWSTYVLSGGDSLLVLTGIK